jgi:hypothetical protein
MAKTQTISSLSSPPAVVPGPRISTADVDATAGVSIDQARHEIVATHQLEDLEAWPPEGLGPVPCEIVTHLIEETARHLGLLDAHREHIDGTTSD